jgi:hypothetical protein
MMGNPVSFMVFIFIHVVPAPLLAHVVPAPLLAHVVPAPLLAHVVLSLNDENFI